MKSIFKFILLFSISITLINCSNDDTSISNIDQNNSILENSTYSKKGLTNPLEYIGIEHNLFMVEFTNELENSYLENDWNGVEFLSSEYKTQFSTIMNNAYHKRYSESTSTVVFQEGIYDQINVSEWFDGDTTTSLDLAEAALNSKATTKDKEFTMNLLTDVFSAIKEAKTDDEAFRSLNEVVSRHENIILTENWNSEERFALGALAVAKHSAQFWENYDLSVFSTSNTSNREASTESSIIVGADVAGYVIGGVVGGVGGSFAGPAGTVGGVLGGKAAGAWAGSAAAATGIAIYNAWNDWFN